MVNDSHCLRDWTSIRSIDEHSAPGDLNLSELTWIQAINRRAAERSNTQSGLGRQPIKISQGPFDGSELPPFKRVTYILVDAEGVHRRRAIRLS